MAKTVLGTISMMSLAGSIISAILYFLGKLSAPDFKLAFLIGSIGWFVFATLWAKVRR